MLLEYFVCDYELTINRIAQNFGGRKLRESATQKHFGRNDIDTKSLVRFVVNRQTLHFLSPKFCVLCAVCGMKYVVIVV